MELRHLRFAVALARAMNFTRAADAMGVAQPALSQAIAALEKELGVALFDRTSRRVRLTGAGALFVERAERVLTDIDAMQGQMQEHAVALRGRVVISTMLFFGETRLPPIVAAFNRLHPGVEIVVRNDTTRRSLDGVRDGSMDIAFFNASDAGTYPDLTFTTVAGDEIVAVLPPGHRFAKRLRLCFADLADEAFVGYEPGSTMYDALVELAQIAGFIPRVVVRSRSTVLVRAFVAAGIGVSTGSRSFCSSPGPAVVTVPLLPAVQISVTMATSPRSAANPAARALADFFLERFHAGPAD
jgi:DNA-binding transcriptional LysR family regulator